MLITHQKREISLNVVKTVFNKIVNQKIEFSTHLLSRGSMQWFKDLIEQKKRDALKVAYLHRKPKFKENHISHAKNLFNKREYFKDLVYLSKLHNIRINQAVNLIIIAYYENLIKGIPLSATHFVKRSKALIQNIGVINVNQNDLKEKIGLRLYKSNFNIFLELRRIQQKSESQIIEEAIQTIFKAIQHDDSGGSVTPMQKVEKKYNHRKARQLKSEEGLAESIGFKAPPETKAKLVQMAKLLGWSQNAVTVEAVEALYEATYNGADWYDILKKRGLDPDILNKLKSK
jgi:hypothetical protein